MNVKIVTLSKIIVININSLTENNCFCVMQKNEGKTDLIERVSEEYVTQIVAMNISPMDNEVTIITNDLTIRVKNDYCTVQDAISFAIKTELKRDLKLYNIENIWERSEIVRIMGVI